MAVAEIRAHGDSMLRQLGELLTSHVLGSERAGAARLRQVERQYLAASATGRELVRRLGALRLAFVAPWHAAAALGLPERAAEWVLNDLAAGGLLAPIGVDAGGQERFRLHAGVTAGLRHVATAGPDEHFETLDRVGSQLLNAVEQHLDAVERDDRLSAALRRWWDAELLTVLALVPQISAAGLSELARRLADGAAQTAAPMTAGRGIA